DTATDPFGDDGSLCPYYFFFYNRKLKRIVPLTCRILRYVMISKKLLIFIYFNVK
ncbi:hypothetical protein DAPPUDRAFT_57606, partial [Daphnia pulex]